jgi:hypothetical protein
VEIINEEPSGLHVERHKLLPYPDWFLIALAARYQNLGAVTDLLYQNGQLIQISPANSVGIRSYTSIDAIRIYRDKHVLEYAYFFHFVRVRCRTDAISYSNLCTT